MKIAVVQTGCWGDNVNSTLMFKPIKNKYPNSTMDIFTSDRYHTPFINNPYINEIIKLPSSNKNDALHLMHTIKPQGYDLIVKNHPMLNQNWSSHKNPQLGENLILSWVNWLESNDVPYEMPLTTDLILTQEEENTPKEFIEKHISKDRKGIVLIEAESESGQSFWNAHWTDFISKTLCQKGYIVLINSIREAGLAQNLQAQTQNRIIWIGGFAIRTVAAFYDHCSAFISVSSGLSNACNTQQRKIIPTWIEVVNSLTCSSNVIRSTGKTFWHDNDMSKLSKFIERTL